MSVYHEKRREELIKQWVEGAPARLTEDMKTIYWTDGRATPVEYWADIDGCAVEQIAENRDLVEMVTYQDDNGSRWVIDLETFEGASPSFH